MINLVQNTMLTVTGTLKLNVKKDPDPVDFDRIRILEKRGTGYGSSTLIPNYEKNVNLINKSQSFGSKVFLC